MNWYFIRHGQIASNLNRVYSGRSDEALTEAGREQVRQAARELADIEIDAIYSSPLTRTRQSAEIIVDELNWDLPIRIDGSFNEMQMGPWEGMAEDDVAAGFPAEWAIWHSEPAALHMDGRETLAELQHRVLDGLRSIRQSAPGQSVLIVTHVAVIRMVFLHADRQDLNRYKTIPVDNAKCFHFAGLEL
jgi:broad specificity phosphatase PhoE